MSSNRRNYFRKNRKAIRREQKHSISGILSGIFGILAVMLFFISAGKTFREGGASDFWLGTMGLFGLVFAIGALALSISAFREKNIRPVPARVGLFSGGILTIVFAGLYVYGIVL